ncbi:autotransporter domain-containing protein [Chlamydia suis]|uniref:polymorphic outer membrane protein middle domain-containing protein n=2 Tax=Chlamydia suis TaxID=83559 RepID=UPI0009B04950|nr:polymorphic outer membrane protein middle domain-containing protein [Chlamydia suis]QYC78938.1 autotransporter domain-containing protein [Chlamydia suis]QYC79901.1 autotransporter domain-containing protein [Chlamydia suis]QYC82690.1 autotransporter domain-containing protein [Chlamydia suis]QYC85369.1 autotransporter domain-containing protein [Chlamydia suis]
MKWMSATAVFAAVLPSVSGFCFPESKELNFSRTGTSTNFTETIDENGTEYIVSGNASFTNFTNIPVKTTTSDTSTSTTASNSKPSADIALTGKLVSAASSSSGTTENTTNTPDPKGGGAFYNEHSGVLSFMTRSGTEGSLTLSNIKMTGDGGAIFSQGELLFTDLTGLTIKENLSQLSGGGIFGGSKISLSGITQATFSSNAAEIVVAEETPPPAKPETVTTTDSTSSGSISSSAHSRFICASATPTTGSDTSSDHRPGSGGAVYAREDFTVSDSTEIVFSTNKASKDGGAIFSEKNILFEQIGSLKVQSNGADEKGGGIYARGDLSIQSSKHTLFNSNASKQGGGALYIEGNVNFQNLEELHIKYNKSGTFETKKVTLSLPNSQTSTDITKNSLAASSQSGSDTGTTTSTPVTAKGGGIYTDKNLSISNVTGIIEIANNKATDVGGGAYVKGTLTCENSHRLQFLKNSSDKKGGGLYGEDSITLSNLTGKTLFQENTAKEEGGGLFIKGDDKPLIMTGLDSFCLINNTSATSGGGAYVSKEISQTYIATIEEFPGITPVHGETIITGNKATGGSGGGVCTKRLALSNLQTVSLSENSASANGGGAYTCPDNFPSPVADSSTPAVTPPTPGAPGAAASSSLFFLTASTDPVAAAPNADQEIDPNADKDFLIDYVVNTTISKNTAKQKGAGVYAKKAKLSRIDALNISNNSAQETGGGICCTESLELDAIVSLSVTDNLAGKEGGALHAKTLTVSHLQSGFSFSNNTANSSSTGAITTTTQPASPSAALPKASAGGPSAPSQTTPTYAGVVGGAIYGDTVSFSKCSGLCQFSGNSAIDNTPSSPSLNVQGGAIYAKTSLSIEAEDPSTSYVFAGNSVSSGKAQTSGQIAGGAIFSPKITLNCPTTFSGNTASMATATSSSGSSIKDTIGGAIAGTTISLSGTSRFSENAADLGAAIGTLGAPSGSQPTLTEKISLENGSFSFEKNKANKRGAIYAPSVSIKGNNITFNQNTSKHDGSAIYFTKDATIESLGSVLFTGNNVTDAQANSPQTPGQTTNTTNYGAAIFGDPGSSPQTQTDTTLKLIASSGNITFSNNSQNTNPDNPAKKFCSIAGYVKLSLQAAQGRSISFFDSIHTSTKKTGQTQSNYESLDINKSENNKTYSGTISFSSELHENKSYIPQNVVLHSGTLVLKEKTELHVVSFEQKPGSSLIMEPGAVLSNQNIANGALAINGLTIDLSSMGTPQAGEIFSPPELRIVATSSNSAGGGGSSNSGGASGSGGGVGGVGGKVTASKELYTAAAAVPVATNPTMSENKVFLTGNLTLIDPNGNFYQNPILGTDLSDVPLIKLPSNTSDIDVSDLTLSGDLSPKKGYIGTWTLNPDPQTGKVVANWKFDMYRRWVYIPRDNHFYANSILGSQNSMIVVKQGLINNMLNNARFDDIAYNNFWVSGVGTFLSQQGTPLSEEFSYYSRGTSVAIDAKPRPDFILGAAFSKMVGRTKAIKKIHNYFHKGSEYSYQASVYGGKFLYFLLNKQQGWALPFLLQGVVSYGHIKHDTTTRYPSIHELNKGDWEDLGWLVDLRVSMDLKEPSKNSSKRVSLYGELEYSSIRQKAFTEIDYDPRHFDDCAYRNLSVPVGCSFEGAIMSYDILMYNKLSLAYMPSIYRNIPVCKYRVLSSNETGEVVCGVPTRTSARAEYSTQLYLGPFWTLYGNYTIDVGMYTLSQMTSCGARMIF